MLILNLVASNFLLLIALTACKAHTTLFPFVSKAEPRQCECLALTVQQHSPEM